METAVRNHILEEDFFLKKKNSILSNIDKGKEFKKIPKNVRQKKLHLF